MVTVNIVSRRGKDLGSFTIDKSDLVGELKRQFAEKYPRWSVHRQYFTRGEGASRVALKDASQSLKSYGVTTDTTLVFKDLGPQIGWRTVFLIEYFGPLLMHTLCYAYTAQVYGWMGVPGAATYQHHRIQTLAYFCVMAHYLKRELESVFVHRFSAATMPAFNVIKNSSHYWLLGGLFIAYFLYHPLYTPQVTEQQARVAVALFAVAELGNLWSHITLARLRPPGTTRRGIPRGQLFELVSCANYTWELAAWAVFCYLTRCATAYLFWVVSAVQITLWALKKHRALRKEFPKDKRLARKALFPFLL